MEQSEGVERNRCSLIGGVSAGMVQLPVDRRRPSRSRFPLSLARLCVCTRARVVVRGGEWVEAEGSGNRWRQNHSPGL